MGLEINEDEKLKGTGKVRDLLLLCPILYTKFLTIYFSDYIVDS